MNHPTGPTALELASATGQPFKQGVYDVRTCCGRCGSGNPTTLSIADGEKGVLLTCFSGGCRHAELLPYYQNLFPHLWAKKNDARQGVAKETTKMYAVPTPRSEKTCKQKEPYTLQAATLADLLPQIKPRNNGKAVTGWLIYDNDGTTLLGARVRYNYADGSKDVLPWRYDGNGVWVNKGFKMVPYWPNGVPPADTLKLSMAAEGEKTADALQADFPEYHVFSPQGGTNLFAKADLSSVPTATILCPDADNPEGGKIKGVEAMKDLKAKLLKERSLPSELMDITGFKDAWDYADGAPPGYRIEDVRRRIQDAEERLLSLDRLVEGEPDDLLPPTEDWADIRATEFPPEKYVVNKLLPCSLAAIYGAGKIGKSFLCLDLLWSVATGAPFLGRQAVQGKVLFLDYESKQSKLKKRMVQDLERISSEADGKLKYMKMKPIHNLLEPPIFEALKKRVRDIGDVRLIVIDTMERAIKARGRGTAYQMDVDRLEQIQEWASDEEICVFFIHHTTKAKVEGGESYDGASGSRGITGTVETNLSLVRKNGDNFLLSIQSRDMEDMQLSVVKEGVRFRVLEEDEVEAAEAGRRTEQQNKVLNLLRTTPWLNPTVISSMTDVKLGTVKPMLASWARSGKLQTKADGRKTLYALADKPVENGEYLEAEDDPGF